MLTIDLEKLPSYQMGMKKGRQEGTHAQALAIAKKLLTKGMAAAEVAGLVDLEVAEVEALKTPPAA